MSPDRQRRRLLGGLLAAGLVGLPNAARGATAPRVATVDYGVGTTLLALGVVPTAIAGADRWPVWVVEPELPASVVNLGKDQELNLELLAALAPDLIVATPYVARLVPILERIAPVFTVSIYAEDGRPLARSVAATRLLGDRLDRQAEADRYLAETDRFLDLCADRVARLGPPPVALVNFMDARHARIYGRSSLYHDVLHRIGIANAWAGPTNYWGFQTIGLEQLATAADPDLRLIAFEPIPDDVRPTLAASPLWTNLPFVRADRVSTLPGVLMFGMLPSARRFAGLLVDHLEDLAA